MHLARLRIENFRCLDYVDLEPSSRINLLVGENASGKSSLLEAIYFLGRGRSFRRAPAPRLVRRGTGQLSVFAAIDSGGTNRRRVGITHGGHQTRAKVDEHADASRLELVNALPVQLIDPGLHRLLEEGPGERRRYLDWGVFHVEHAFYPAWRRYRRVLRQRNRALRYSNSNKAVKAWDSELIRSADAVDRCRRNYIQRLQPLLARMTDHIIGEGGVALEYHPGWPREKDFAAALADGIESDIRAGYTRIGPHRADLKVAFGSVKARDWVSRGQQKVLSASLLVAQAALHTEQAETHPVLLIDDIAAELGASYRAALVREIERIGVQCFMTFLDPANTPDISADARMFHVEHGRVFGGV